MTISQRLHLGGTVTVVHTDVHMHARALNLSHTTPSSLNFLMCVLFSVMASKDVPRLHILLCSVVQSEIASCCLPQLSTL